MAGWGRSLHVIAITLATTSVAAQERALQLNTPVERPLSPRDVAHEYTVTTPEPQALTVTVQQQGIDVVVTVLGPDGTQIIQVDSASDDHGTGGSEVAHVTALAPGEYHVRVAPFERADAKAAKYTITLSEMRPLTAEERTNAESEKEIAAIERRWEAAIDKLDIATLTDILRKDGFGMGPFAAATLTRKQVVARWEDEIKERAKLGLTRDHTISEHVVRAAGAAAVSTGRFLITTTFRGRDQNRFSGQFVHVWAKDSGTWKLVGDYTFPFGRMPRQQTTAPTVSPAVLSAYAGTYGFESGSFTISFTVENGVLNAQWINPFDTSPKMPLTAISETTFTGSGTDEITFVRSASGEVRELIVVSDGPSSRAIRVK